MKYSPSIEIECSKEFSDSKKGEGCPIIGLAGYYRKFRKDFSKIAKPLMILTKKDIKFDWTNKRTTKSLIF